jgi:hypothetical protein
MTLGEPVFFDDKFFVRMQQEVDGFFGDYRREIGSALQNLPDGTPHLHNNIEERWLTERLKAMQLDEPGMGWRAFRRFRNTWLRGRRCQEDIKNFWMGHKPRTMSALYSHLFEEVELRLAESAQVGVGFDIPAYIAPKLLQRICAIRRSGQYVSGCEIMELPRMGG